MVLGWALALEGTASSVSEAQRVPSTALLIALALFFLLLIVASVGLVFLIFRKRGQSERPSQGGQSQATPKRLLSIWRQFLEPLPVSVRVAIQDYDHFVVFGDPGVGKSALISRRVDWQGQASQFLPSHTADPLLQIYLGSHTIVQEISSTLLQVANREAHDAFRKLWKKSLPSTQLPTVVVVLKISTLANSSPDVLRQQAKLIRGKTNLLAELFGAPILTRLCLTNMERISGYSEFSRFLHKNRIPLQLNASGDAQGGLGTSLQSYEKHLPRALTTMPVGPFEASIEILHSAEELMAPVRSFIAALVEGSVASLRPDVQSVYFFSLPADEDVGNPFDPVVNKGARAPSLFSRWLRWLAGLGIRPIHAILSLLLLAAGVGPVWYVTRRHSQKVQRASITASEFERAVRRAQESLSNPSESEVVRTSEREVAQALAVVQDEEARFRPLKLLLQREKSEARQHFVDGLRQGYLRPSLEAGVRQRARDKILYSLAALYAAQGNALGTLVQTQRTDFAPTLGLPGDILIAYVANSPKAWADKALLLLPPMPSESAHWPISDLRPWHEFVQTIARAIPQPSIAGEQLERLRKQAEHLRETIERVRKAHVMRRIYQMLAEETPIDMNKLFGGEVGVLTPDPWLTDNMANLELLLKLIRESSAQSGRHDHLSLYQLLRWVNALGTSKEAGTRGPGISPLFENDLVHFAFPGTKVYEISERGWLDLLLRSRKRWLLSHQISNVRLHDRHSHRRRCCDCVSERRRKRKHCVPCEGSEGDSQRKSCRPPRTESLHQELPPFSPEELRPRLANLLSKGETPNEHLGDEYNRAVFDNEVLPLVRELRKAVAESNALGPEEKIRLAQLVRTEIEGYARKYCGGLMHYYLSYHFHVHDSGNPVLSVHTALLDLTKPGSRFVSHLSNVAENAALAGLDDPYLRPLAECLAEFRPLVKVVNADLLKRKNPTPHEPVTQGGEFSTNSGSENRERTNAKKPTHSKGTAATPADKDNPGPRISDDSPASADDDKPKGLEQYLESIAKLAAELDSNWGPLPGKASEKSTDKKPSLADHLGPLGRSALAMAREDSAGDPSPRQDAEKFLDKSGLIGSLRRPFIEPFDVVFKRGSQEVEKALAQHWETETVALVAPLLDRFPFNQAAEREVAPSELDLISEANGAFFSDLKSYYDYAVTQQGSTYVGRRFGLGSFVLPKDLLPTVNRVAKLARMLFDGKGARQPLRLSIRGVPGKRAEDGKSVQPTMGFLQIGKTSVFGFNQRATGEQISVDWWNQGVAMVGVESTASRSGRRHSQTIEVADSSWSLFRLLQKSTLEGNGESTWRINDEGAGEVQVIRFAIQPDPWSLFRITTR